MFTGTKEKGHKQRVPKGGFISGARTEKLKSNDHGGGSGDRVVQAIPGHVLGKMEREKILQGGPWGTRESRKRWDINDECGVIRKGGKRRIMVSRRKAYSLSIDLAGKRVSQAEHCNQPVSEAGDEPSFQ